ncbi:MAG: hypothetical protein HY703_12740 [Gemmatimonadetes bacterium]|nr:hypothetical protein [Gemmatimonadota bacterium]
MERFSNAAPGDGAALQEARQVGELPGARGGAGDTGGLDWLQLGRLI